MYTYIIYSIYKGDPRVHELYKLNILKLYSYVRGSLLVPVYTIYTVYTVYTVPVYTVKPKPIINLLFVPLVCFSMYPILRHPLPFVLCALLLLLPQFSEFAAASPTQPDGGAIMGKATRTFSATTDAGAGAGSAYSTQTSQVLPIGDIISKCITGVTEIFQDLRRTITYFGALSRNFTHGGEWKEWYKTAVGGEL